MRTIKSWILAAVSVGCAGLLVGLPGCKPQKAPDASEAPPKTSSGSPKRLSPDTRAPLPGDVPGLVQALVAEANPGNLPVGHNARLGEPSPRLAAIADALAASVSPELPEALLTVVRSGNDTAAARACEILARRADSEAAPVIWERATSKRASPLLLREIHRALSRLDRQAVALLLIEKAADPDFQKRELALAFLVSAPHASAVGTLVEALGDNSTAIQGLAKEALVRIGPAAIPGLRDAATQPRGRSCQGAIEALARLGDPEGMRLLADALAGSSSFAQMNARTALERALRPQTNAHPWYLENVSEFTAAEERFERISQSAFDALAPRLQAGLPAVRVRLVEALGLTGHRAAAVLRDLAKRDPDAKVRAAAHRQLGGVAGREALPTLLQSLQTEASCEGAMAALMPLITDADLPLLRPALDHSSVRVRACTLCLMRQLRSAEARRILIERAGAGEESEARNALVSLGYFPYDPVEIPGLRQATGSVHYIVRVLTAELLGKRNTPEARALLLEITRHADLRTAEAAEQALGATDDPRAFWPLFDVAARRAEDGVNQGLSPALRLLGKAVWRSVLPLLDDPLPRRRAIAAACLWQIQEPEVKPELARRMLKGEREIILNAAGAFEDGADKAVEAVLVNWMDSRVPAGRLAAQFLNSTNAALRGASHSWHARHGYTVTGPGMILGPQPKRGRQ